MKCVLIFLAEMEGQLDEGDRRILLGNNRDAEADSCGWSGPSVLSSDFKWTRLRIYTYMVDYRYTQFQQSQNLTCASNVLEHNYCISEGMSV